MMHMVSAYAGWLMNTVRRSDVYTMIILKSMPRVDLHEGPPGEVTRLAEALVAQHSLCVLQGGAREDAIIDV